MRSGGIFSWLLAARNLYQRGVWDPAWPPPPDFSAMVGVELRDKMVRNGNITLHSSQSSTTVELMRGNMADADVSGFNAITILDALHYLQAGQQQRLVQHIAAALSEDGVFITRIGDAGAGWPFRLSVVADSLVSLFQGCRPTLYHRTLAQWVGLLDAAGLTAAAIPMRSNLALANVMLVAHKNRS